MRQGAPRSRRTHEFLKNTAAHGVESSSDACGGLLRWFTVSRAVTFTRDNGATIWRGAGSRSGLWGAAWDPHVHPDRRGHLWRRWLAGGQTTAHACAVGRLAHEKNLGELLEAWRQAYRTLGQRATVVVAGEDPRRARIESACRRRLLGFSSAGSLATLYREADVRRVPSPTEPGGWSRSRRWPRVRGNAGRRTGWIPRKHSSPARTGVLVPANDRNPITAMRSSRWPTTPHRSPWRRASRRRLDPRCGTRERRAARPVRRH